MARQWPYVPLVEYLQGSIFEPVLFNVFVSVSNNGLEDILSKFLNDKG